MLNSPYSKDSVRQGILHYLLGRGLAGFAGFATVILLVRYMDVQSYAGFTALSGLIAMSGVCAGLGLERAISRYVPEARLERSAAELGSFIWRISLVRLCAALVVCLLFFVFWKYILRIFSDVHLIQFPISLVYFVVAETLFQHFSSILQALVKQKALTRILVVQWGGRLLMITWVMFYQANISLEDSLWIMAVPEMIGVLVFVLLLLHDLNTLKKEEGIVYQVKTSAPWPNWSEVYRVAGHNYGFTLLAAPPQGYFMKMLAAAFLPTQMVAAYGFFISIAERARQYIPLHLLYNLIEPVMIGTYLINRDFSTLNNRCQLLYKSNLVMLIPLLAWVAAAGTFIITTLTGGKFQEYLWLLMVVMLQLTIGSHVVLLQLILNSVGSSVLLVRAGVIALLGMAIFLFVTMFISVQLLVIAPLIFSLICNAHIIHALKGQGYPYKIHWSLFLGAVASGLVAYLVTSALIIPQSLNYYYSLSVAILTGLMILMIYMAGLYFFKAIGADEIGLVKSLLSKKNIGNKKSMVSGEPMENNIISQLQIEARKILDEIIPQDAHIILLDYPNNTNVGDSLIWLGEIAYLESRGFKPAYVCDVKNYCEASISKLINKNSMILMHGGGNFGTMWTEIHNFRLQVLSDFPNIPIVQLPQTIHFNNEAKTKEMADAIKVQGNYTLLARSQPSYDFAQGNFNANIRLCPDMAFFIGAIHHQSIPQFDRFVLARTDHEKSGDLLVETIKALESGDTYEIADWLAASWQERLLHRIEIHTVLLRRKLDPNNQVLFYLWNALSQLRLKRGISLLTRGRIVLTDRLHAHVLSILLNKPHVLVDNSYGKIGNFYKTWTHSHALTKFVTDLANLHLVADQFDASLSPKKEISDKSV